MKDEAKFAIVPLEKLEQLLEVMLEVKAEIAHLREEKHLPSELTIKESEQELRLSRQRIYTMIYTGDLKAVQYKKRGKVLIPRDEILHYKSRNIKSMNGSL